MAEIPQDLVYTRTHEWARIEGDAATVGITDHAQEELGDVVFVELPEVGSSVQAGEPFGTIESVKAVSDLYSPVSGEVTEVNTSLEESPEKVNEDPYGEGWLLRVRLSEEPDLLSPEEYARRLEEEE
ncbi:glycine cleavage system H protein [Rubrobacter xylanophilus DSM 9941]|uniref:Glycine cleavage system H protein n=1 Tax=Rubrobacter xylanophilus (strain DSM 9941 / JCM 11954 / NBRC 16129 / PRD-1) TaxID=266117 RepID=GCSH_RUBXD|nr:glycine cleavage system protein GcvH [Rubrobacter xylanophilus]Q1AR90.1 RecName: Full=Glycine cleavage system H protein [Rubrobacter xylanophilus DSM 9941]ABG06088.1 glycine cleavage system H protein [Rubrobacter xylanophilus DSM 9941]